MKKTLLVLSYAVIVFFFLWLVASVINVAATNLPTDSATPAWWNFFEIIMHGI